MFLHTNARPVPASFTPPFHELHVTTSNQRSNLPKIGQVTLIMDSFDFSHGDYRSTWHPLFITRGKTGPANFSPSGTVTKGFMGWSPLASYRVSYVI